MKKLMIMLGILLGLIGLLVITNPSPQDHKIAIKEFVMESVKKKMEEDQSLKDNPFNHLALGFVKALVDTVIDKGIKVKSAGLFSGATIPEKNNQTITIGVLGKVFILFTEEQLNEIMEENNNTY